MSLLVKTAAAALAISVLAGVASANPYASKIRVSSTAFSAASPMTITYRLNEAADTLQVEILNGNTPVATFNAPKLQGANQVVWNGRTDNATGALVPAGSYRVRITANKNSAGWSEIASNTSLGNYVSAGIYHTLFSGYSPQDHLFVTQTDSDSFGLGFSPSSWSDPNHAGSIAFNSDLSTYFGDSGYASRIFKAVPLETQATPVAPFDLWGGGLDPDGEYFYNVGRNTTLGYRIWLGRLSANSVMVDADPTGLYPDYPRDIEISKEGNKKFAYITQTGSAIVKAEIDLNTHFLSGAAKFITAPDVPYELEDLAFDAPGNLYCSAYEATGQTGLGGGLFRWNVSQIAGALPATLLSPANAVWNVTYPSNMLYMDGVTVTPNGNIYVVMSAGTDQGIYYVGNSSQATLVKTLSTADKVVDLAYMGAMGSWSVNVQSDPVGNLVVIDRNNEQIRLFGPSGNSTNPIVAPTSQTFAIQNAGVDTWSLY